MMTIALRLGFGWKKEGGHHAPPKFKCRCYAAYDHGATAQLSAAVPP